MTLAGEWTKLVTLRSTYVVVALSILVGTAVTALLAIVIGANWDEWTAAERSDFHPVLVTSPIGMFLATIILTVLGVRAVTSEYSSGMIRLTLTATPRRGRVLLAKVAAVAGIGLAAGAVAGLATFVVGQAIFAAYGLETASLAEGETLRTVLLLIVVTPVLPLIGLALGFALRSAAGAITSVLMLVFGPLILTPLLPDWWQDDVVAYLPAQASDAVTVGHIPEAEVTGPAAGVAALVLAAWLVGLLAIAHLVFTRRDA